MRNSLFILLIGILISVTSCRQDFNFETNSGNLAFSKDTVYLDTVFKNIGSSTYTLKVYNKTNKDISIPSIALGKGTDSKYRMMVDGMRGNNGKMFNNVELLAKDSLFIFIETTADIKDADPNNFLYTDQILFGAGAQTQKVELVTLIQDAYFIYPKRDNGIYEEVPIGINSDNTVATVIGRDLDHNHPDNGDEYTWTNKKPYVVYGFASVPANETLTVEAGTRVHFHANSGLIVQKDASLKINGDISTTDKLEKEIIFEGDRLEPFYSDVPGQWGFVYLRDGSKDHQINHLTLKNAQVGIIAENNAGVPMSLTNTQIYDCSNIGFYGIHANVQGSNVVINSAGQVVLACSQGGSYNFKHCTFNNNWPSSKQLAVLIDNYYLDANQQPVVYDLTEATFSNSIIYGANSVEMLLNKKDSKQFNYKFNNCLIKFNNQYNQFTNDPLYDFANTDLYSNCLIAKDSYTFDPKFEDANNNKLNIDDKSAAYQKGDPAYLVNVDIVGNNRDAAKPDLGAYANKAFKK